MSVHPGDQPPNGDQGDEVAEAFERTVDEGRRRLTRTLPSLLATGAVGGVDITLGILALLLVEEGTRNPLVSALAFPVGFIALSLANSELFTENFLVPIAAMAAGSAGPAAVLRLWAGTLVMNLAAGWVMMLVVVTALPRLHPTAIEVGEKFAAQPIGWQSFSSALLGGAIITLMTWMERSTTSVPGQLTAAVIAAFLLAAGPLDHVIVASLEMFAALHSGATFGYLTWAREASWFALGNMVGGIGLVTIVRLVQVGERKIREVRSR